MTTKQVSGRKGRGEQQEDPACPALRHRHSIRGWYEDHCICPTTRAVYEAKLAYVRRHHHGGRGETRRQQRQARLLIPEIDDCPAQVHRHSREGYISDGCRCPSTVKRYERWLEINRQASARYRARTSGQPSARDPSVAVFNLGKADRFDAEALAMGYPLGQRVSLHTRALAVQMMRQASPGITAEEIAWRLTNGGQSRLINHLDGTSEVQPVSQRQVQRIIAGLKIKESQKRHRDNTRLRAA